jgi:hypothetical protein
MSANFYTPVALIGELKIKDIHQNLTKRDFSNFSNERQLSLIDGGQKHPRLPPELPTPLH